MSTSTQSFNENVDGSERFQPNTPLLWVTWMVAISVMFLYITVIIQHILGLTASWTRLYHVKHNDILEWPSVSIIKPLLGVDSQLRENLETFFNLNYRGKWELLFCFENQQDQAVALVRSLMEKYPNVDARIFLNDNMEPDTTDTIVNPMVKNMVQGYENSRYEFIWISSARCRGNGVMLRDMVARACEPNVGIVHQLPFIWQSVGDVAALNSKMGIGAVLERIYFATSLARNYMALSLMRFNCFTGMSYIYQRCIMEKAGGLRCYGRYLAEDMNISLTLQKLGYRLEVSAIPAMQNNGPYTPIKYVKDRLVRWHRLRSYFQPFTTFCLEPFQDCLLFCTAASWAQWFLFGTEPFYLFTVILFTWFCFDVMIFYAVERHMNQPVIHPFLYITAWTVLQFVTLYVCIESLCNLRHVKWGKHTYKLSRGTFADVVK